MAGRWFGFSDSQSRIDRFTWRAGTSKGGSDVMVETNAHRNSNAINTNITLPTGVRIYITVTSYNRAGMLDFCHF